LRHFQCFSLAEHPQTEQNVVTAVGAMAATKRIAGTNVRVVHTVVGVGKVAFDDSRKRRLRNGVS
jgi:hypothetical protein